MSRTEILFVYFYFLFLFNFVSLDVGILGSGPVWTHVSVSVYRLHSSVQAMMIFLDSLLFIVAFHVGERRPQEKLFPAIAWVASHATSPACHSHSRSTMSTVRTKPKKKTKTTDSAGYPATGKPQFNPSTVEG